MTASGPGLGPTNELGVAIIASKWKKVVAMAALSIRDLDDNVREKLRVRAAKHGWSMEAEVRAILAEAVEEPGDRGSLFEVLIDRFGALGGVDLELPVRSTIVRSPDLPE